MCKPDRNTAVMIIKHKIRRAIDWINIKGKLAICLCTGISLGIFFSEESCSRKDLAESFDQEPLDLHIVIGAEVRKPLFLMDHCIGWSGLDHLFAGFADQTLDRTVSGIHSFLRIFFDLRCGIFSHCFRYRTIHGRILLHFICAERFLLLIRGSPRCYIPAAKPADRSLDFSTCTVKAPVPDTTEEPANGIKTQIRKLERSKLEKQLAELYSKGKQETDLKT